MIHVFFVPGMFGTTVEYVIRAFSPKYTTVTADILPNGSMHLFKKESHWRCNDDIYKACQCGVLTDNSISTPIYPFNHSKLPKILEVFSLYITNNDKKILMFADSFESAEKNMLFQYHKITLQSELHIGLSIFFDGLPPNYTRWNAQYTSWHDMRVWELREWLSIFYPVWIDEWAVSKEQVDETFLKISNREMLENTIQCFERINDYCDLSLNFANLKPFITKWRKAQQYILDEYSLLMEIVNATITLQQLNWQPLNIIAEAIIQQHLRSHGYEIRCDGLDTFPTDSKTLYNLLEKV